jgi:hypothetical protein
MFQKSRWRKFTLSLFEMPMGTLLFWNLSS